MLSRQVIVDFKKELEKVYYDVLQSIDNEKYPDTKYINNKVRNFFVQVASSIGSTGAFPTCIYCGVGVQKEEQTVIRPKYFETVVQPIPQSIIQPRRQQATPPLPIPVKDDQHKLVRFNRETNQYETVHANEVQYEATIRSMSPFDESEGTIREDTLDGYIRNLSRNQSSPGYTDQSGNVQTTAEKQKLHSKLEDLNSFIKNLFQQRPLQPAEIETVRQSVNQNITKYNEESVRQSVSQSKTKYNEESATPSVNIKSLSSKYNSENSDIAILMKLQCQLSSSPLINYANENALQHLNVVTILGKQYILTSNKDNQVDFILSNGMQGSPDMTLPVDQMQCSLETSKYLLIGAQQRLYLLDKSGKILSYVKLQRNVQSICAINSETFVMGQQGGQVAAIEIEAQNFMQIVEQIRVVSGVYKMLRTLSGDIAIASSGGLYFCKYDQTKKKFFLSPEVLLVDQIVTAVFEISQDKYVCGVWESPYLAICTRGDPKSFTKIPCNSEDEMQCTDLIPVPDFDVVKNPFLIMRTNQSVNLIDLVKLRMASMVQIRNQKSSFEKMRLVYDPYANQNFLLVFSNNTGAVQEIKINRQFFVELKQMAASRNK